MSHAKLNPPVGPDDHYLGPAHAAVVLVEYGDYQCPHCGRAHAILQEVLARLGDRVRYVFRNFPMSEVHPDADLAAEAAEAVATRGGNGAFWDMHDMLFENQDALSVDDLLGYADAAGMDVGAIAGDLSHGAQRARVQADVASGMRSGVDGTPAFFVNGSRFTGDWTDPAAFAAALESSTYAERQG
jgi:protein-disulfide isomerase